MTINEHISLLRNVIKATPDDSKFSDQFLYTLLKNARAELLRQRADKGYVFNLSNWQSICMPLEKVDQNECGSCTPDSGCYVLRSVYKLPNTLSSPSRMLLNVYTLAGGKAVYSGSFSAALRKKYSKVMKNNLTYTIKNGYLYIFHNDWLKTVMLDAIFEDPTTLSDISACDSNGNPTGGSCYEIMTDEFPLEEYLARTARQMVLEELQLTLRIPDDEVNDTRSQN